MNNKFLISLEGNMGCGKEFFLKFLNKYFKDSLSYTGEQVCTWENENLIKDFYKDQKRWSFLMEITSVTKKIKNVTNFINNEKNEIIVSSRCTSSDKYCFLEALYQCGNVTNKEKSIFCEIFNLLKMPKINVIIYLKSDVNSCFERILNKRRECEKKITFEFINKLHHCYENWIKMLKENNVHVITIDMEENMSIDGDEQIQENILKILLNDLPILKKYLRWNPYKV